MTMTENRPLTRTFKKILRVVQVMAAGIIE